MIKYGVEFSREAELEADAAGEYYDIKVPGLGLRFLDDLNEAIQSMGNNPLSCHVYSAIPAIRRCNLSIFPYAIYFTIESKTVKVLAIIHERRSKSYIKRKLS
jgi:plasmid stabilization system protein ParE